MNSKEISNESNCLAEPKLSPDHGSIVFVFQV